MLEERVAKIESDVEHLQNDVEDLKTDVHGLRIEVGAFRKEFYEFKTEFYEFKVDVTREFGAVRVEMAQGFGSLHTAVEHSKRWMVVTGIGMIASAAGTLVTLGRIMKWF